MLEDCVLMGICRAVVEAANSETDTLIDDYVKSRKLSDEETIRAAAREGHIWSSGRCKWFPHEDFRKVYEYLEEHGEIAAKKRLLKMVRAKYADNINEYIREEAENSTFFAVKNIRNIGVRLGGNRKWRCERMHTRTIDELNASEWIRNHEDALVKEWIKERHKNGLAIFCCKAYGQEHHYGEEQLVERLLDDYKEYFAEKKGRFMEKTEQALAKRKEDLAKIGKHPQSHGGVANLLKVLTKTMHEQGNSIYTIAKVQYQVCIQAGIYIPDEFLTDILVAGDILGEDAK